MSEPSVLQSQAFSGTQSNTHQEYQESDEEEDIEEEEEEEEEYEEHDSASPSRSGSDLSQDQRSENYQAAIDRRSDLEQIFLNYKYEAPKSLGEWGATVLWVMGRRETNYDPDKNTRDSDLNQTPSFLPGSETPSLTPA